MSTLDLGIAERAPDVHSPSLKLTSAAVSRPVPLIATDVADDCFYVGSVKIEPVPQADSTANGVTA